jgi:TIR domain
MTMPEAEGSGIFLSYRRHESKDFAGRLRDRLADRFGEGQVFIDVDAIEPGVDFTEAINRALAACKVLLAIIGPGWLTATDEDGRLRLDDPEDIVRLEIQTALARNVRVIPILVEGAVMPGRDDLPESLAGLAHRNALLIRYESFRSDAGRLVAAIERVLATVTRAAVVPSPADAAGAGPAGNAVSEVAQQDTGPARNDPDRVFRLFTDAERIASSITDESWKVQALRGIAEALAATDPDGAERIAHEITGAHSKASVLVLSGVAAALAATDPDRAARLFTDAERIASSITPESWKASALSSIANALAATDPDRAERITSSITDEPSKAWALRGIAEALAATDPDRAERIARSITPESWKAEALRGIAERLAATDPDRAVRITSSITDELTKASALSGVAKALATTDPDRAARLFTDAERIANSITDSYSNPPALSHIAEALAATDPDGAERIASSITVEVWKAEALSGIAEALAATDPDRAERIASSIADEISKAQALSSIAKALAATDPDRAERIASSITAKYWPASACWKASALSSIAKALAATSS